VDGFGSGLCPIGGFGISIVEPLGSYVIVLITLVTVEGYEAMCVISVCVGYERCRRKGSTEITDATSC
jgi:hypothetical protein